MKQLIIFPELDVKTNAMKKGKTEAHAELGLGVTFKDSLVQGAYGWYPYVEGFSANYIEDILKKHSPLTVFDPFGGSGTTNLAAANMGIASYYCEVNPFMVFVTETKINSYKWASTNKNEFSATVKEYIKLLTDGQFSKRSQAVNLESYYDAFPGRDFFVEEHLKQLILARDTALTLKGVHTEAKNLILLACASNVVKSSNMTRRADLRRRRPDEYKNRVVDVPSQICTTLERFLSDIRSTDVALANTRFISSDARKVPKEYEETFDLALTSPPYLNGTNYFRNTKLELWFSGFICGEKDLPKLTRAAITAGINNVSKLREKPRLFDIVEDVVLKLDDAATDRRIPILVRQYVSDMYEVFRSTLATLKPGGRFLLDIGDSKFYGVHVPTDRFLVQAALDAGFCFVDREIIARRHSRDKSPLVQVELIFEKPRK